MNAQLIDRPLHAAECQMTRRLLTLTGTTVAESAITVDSAGQWAIAVVDGAVFRPGAAMN